MRFFRRCLCFPASLLSPLMEEEKFLLLPVSQKEEKRKKEEGREGGFKTALNGRKEGRKKEGRRLHLKMTLLSPHALGRREEEEEEEEEKEAIDEMAP